MAVVVPYVVMTAVSIGISFAMQALQSPVKNEIKLGEIAKQTAKEGGARLIVWGIVRPIGGNLVACSDPNIVKTSTSSGGKGGGGAKQTTTSENVYRTYAIGVCEGPITGYRRIWRNNKLVYDSRTDETGALDTWGATNNPIFLQKATLYLGDYAQLPDPSLEGIFGVGEVPAMRGTAYMVMNNENLTDLGGAVPQYIFEVVRAEGVALTSRPYPVEDIESIKINDASIVSGDFRAILSAYDTGNENINLTNASIVSGEFRSILSGYDSGSENIDLTDADITGGVFNQILFAHDSGNESIDLLDADITGGVFNKILIEYSNWPPEGIDMLDASITGGVHEIP